MLSLRDGFPYDTERDPIVSLRATDRPSDTARKKDTRSHLPYVQQLKCTGMEAFRVVVNRYNLQVGAIYAPRSFNRSDEIKEAFVTVIRL